MKLFVCPSCGADIHFDNLQCLNCGAELAFRLRDRRMAELSRAEDGHLFDPVTGASACANRETIGCSWLAATGGNAPLCLSCGRTLVIPDQSVPGNQDRWARLESAKRLVFYGLTRLGLPFDGCGGEPEHLTFRLLGETDTPAGHQTVTTGHDHGLITLDIAEANDAERERTRVQLGEPYRTLVGHVRHESGHFYWDILVRDGGQLDRFRSVFGDEREDYETALSAYYAEGGPTNWSDAHVSPYASAHPWEDFAESFAHYLHMLDGLETGGAYGFDLRSSASAATMPDPYRYVPLDTLLDEWRPLTVTLNAMNRSIGQPDFYPFVVTETVASKLAFVHTLVHERTPRC